MNKHNSNPKQLTLDIMGRSICNVQVGATIWDTSGRLISWGWNNAGRWDGVHAEAHAISRANLDRLPGATIYVAGLRKKSGAIVPALPCEKCFYLINKHRISTIIWRSRFGLGGQQNLWVKWKFNFESNVWVIKGMV